MPLHSGWDRMAVVLLTLKHLENLRTEDAINKYKQELGGDAMRRLPDRQQSACAKGQLHKHWTHLAIGGPPSALPLDIPCTSQPTCVDVVFHSGNI